jgi:hypothetical protein
VFVHLNIKTSRSHETRISFIWKGNITIRPSKRAEIEFIDRRLMCTITVLWGCIVRENSKERKDIAQRKNSLSFLPAMNPQKSYESSDIEMVPTQA